MRFSIKSHNYLNISKGIFTNRKFSLHWILKNHATIVYLHQMHAIADND